MRSDHCSLSFISQVHRKQQKHLRHGSTYTTLQNTPISSLHNGCHSDQAHYRRTYCFPRPKRRQWLPVPRLPNLVRDANCSLSGANRSLDASPRPYPRPWNCSWYVSRASCDTCIQSYGYGWGAGCDTEQRHDSARLTLVISGIGFTMGSGFWYAKRWPRVLGHAALQWTRR